MTSKSILLVDDEEDIRTILSTKLRAAGFHVTLATDGREASRAVARGKFDLIITDVLMPDKDGLEFVEELSKMKPMPAVIAMSGGGAFPAKDYLRLARHLGAKTILQKPFSDEQFFESIVLALPEAPP